MKEKQNKSYQEKYFDGEIEKIPVEFAHIISNTTAKESYGGNIYHEIVYKPIDEDTTYFGFGSYYLDLVLDWLKKFFDIRGTTDERETKQH